MVAGRLALAFLTHDFCVRHSSGQRRRTQHEVDAQSTVLRETQLCVIPIGVDGWARREWPYHVSELGLDDRVERGPLRRRHVRAVLIELDAPHVLIGRRDVPVADQSDLRLW